MPAASALGIVSVDRNLRVHLVRDAETRPYGLRRRPPILVQLQAASPSVYLLA